MAQHDYDIANQTAPNLRSDINNVLAAIVSQNSGSTAPSSTYANMIWYDTANNILKIRNEADDSWINVAYLNQSDNSYAILEGTKIRDASGTEIGEVGSGGLVLLETQTASGSSTLDFTNFDNTKYDTYFFMLDSIIPNTSTVTFEMLLSSDGGSTFANSTGSYIEGGAAIEVAGPLDAGEVLSGEARLYSASSASTKTMFNATLVAITDSGTNVVGILTERDARSVAEATDAAQFRFSSGNITSGVIRMYGVLK